MIGGLITLQNASLQNAQSFGTLQQHLQLQGKTRLVKSAG